MFLPTVSLDVVNKLNCNCVTSIPLQIKLYPFKILSEFIEIPFFTLSHEGGLQTTHPSCPPMPFQIHQDWALHDA